MKNITFEASEDWEIAETEEFTPNSRTNSNPLKSGKYDPIVRHSNCILYNEKGKVKDYNAFILELKSIVSTIQEDRVATRKSTKKAKKHRLADFRDWRTNNTSANQCKLYVVLKSKNEWNDNSFSMVAQSYMVPRNDKPKQWRKFASSVARRMSSSELLKDLY